MYIYVHVGTQVYDTNDILLSMYRYLLQSARGRLQSVHLKKSLAPNI